MHGTIFVNKIIDQVKQKAKDKEIKYIIIEVGKLAPITAAELKNKIVEMTGWTVRAKSLRAKIRCRCGYNSVPEIMERTHETAIYSCPKCEAFMPKIVHGDNIKLVEIGYSE